MNPILAQFPAIITELKRNLSALLGKAKGSPVTIFNHNKPTAYLVPAKTYESLLEMIEDQDLGRIVREREAERSEAVEVSLDAL